MQKKQYVFYGKNKVIQNEYFGFKQRKINLSAVKDAASMEINFIRYNMDTTLKSIVLPKLYCRVSGNRSLQQKPSPKYTDKRP